MSQPSTWPLPPDGIRHIVPRDIVAALAQHPLASGVVPHSFGYYPRAIGHAIERPDHDDHLLILCVAGAGSLTVAAREHAIGRGDLLALRAGTPHRYRADDRDPWTLYWIHFGCTDIEPWLRDVHGVARDVVTHLGDSPRVVADLDTILESRRSPYELAPHVHAANVLRQLLAYLALVRAPHRDDALVDAAHALMQARLHGDLSLDEMAAHTGLSRFHFARRYRQLTGTAPGRRFIHLKIQRACHLLDVSDASISEVAASLGYGDALYFSRQFRRVTGLSPSRYRSVRHG